MKLAGYRKVSDAQRRHSAGRRALERWHAEVKAANWETTADLRNTFPSADFIGNDTVVFNIGGNNYRIVAKIDLNSRRVAVLHVFTHSEYDKWNKLRSRP